MSGAARRRLSIQSYVTPNLLKQGLAGATQEQLPGSDDHGRGDGTAHHGGSARVPSPRRSPYRGRSRRAQQLQLAEATSTKL